MATIVTPNKSDIYEEDISYRSSISEELLRKIAASVNAINHNALNSIGEIKPSLLTEALFQQENSNAWVLMDGRDVTTTDYGQLILNAGLATGVVMLPDARGMALVGVNNGRSDGNEIFTDLSLGGFLPGGVKSHTHNVNQYEALRQTIGTASASRALWDGVASVASGANSGSQPQNTVNSIGVNWFIKVWNNAQEE